MAKKNLTLEEKLEEAIVKEGPYEVPGNWIWVKLNNGFAQCLDSFRKPVNSTERANRIGEIPYYGATGQVGFIDDYLTEDNLVLVGEDGAPFFDLLKNKAYIIEGKAWVNNHAHILKSNFGITGNKYLMHYLNSFNYNGYVNGTTRLKLTQASMNSIPIPLPPLKEQQRIVDRIESLFEKLDKAKELIEEAREGFEKRKSAVLEKAFRGELTPKCICKQEILKADKKQLSSDFIEFDIPYKISDRWQWVRFNECCTYLGSGSTPKGGREVYQTDGIPFIRSQNVLRGKLDFEEIVYISDEVHEKMKRTKVYPGDTLLNITGASIGRSAMVNKDDIEEANVNQHVCIFRFKNYILNRYPSYWFNSPIFQDIISKQQIGVTREALNFKQLRGMCIPVPPMEEQKEIVRILDKLLEEESKIEELIQLEEQIELIKKSILAKAFRGELGTNCEDDESALELLKEILSRE